MLRLSLIGIVAIVLLSGPALAQGPRNVQIRTQKITDHVYMLTGQGGNIGLCIGDDGTFMIDDQFAPLTGKIIEAVATVTDDPVKFLINTHWHFDHTGGNENFAGEGAIIFGHDNIRERMSTDQVIAALNMDLPASPPAALPVVTFAESISFHLNGDEIRAFHVPHAHTDGDTIIHFTDSNVFHMGDTFFKDAFPFIDISTGGNVNGVIATADLVLNMCDEDTQIIPGHGALATPADLKAYRDTLSSVRDAVAKLMEEGMGRDEVIAANPTAPWDEAWGQLFIKGEQFTGFVFDSLVGSDD